MYNFENGTRLGKKIWNSGFKVHNYTLTCNFWYISGWNWAAFERNGVRNSPCLLNIALPQPLNWIPFFMSKCLLLRVNWLEPIFWDSAPRWSLQPCFSNINTAGLNIKIFGQNRIWFLKNFKITFRAFILYQSTYKIGENVKRLVQLLLR